MTDWAVRFENVTKTYRRADARYGSLRQSVKNLLAGRSISPPIRKSALVNLDLSIAEGGSYALLGPNGAGKTTALRLITRISAPSEGIIRVRGRVGALMEVGSGIHPELTGRENIWLYGSILGLGRRRIAARFDEIVAFAELDSSIDRQVKYFSSGMQLRLGFAIAAFLEPDIFVVDEALAVGDAGFQAKCVRRMGDLVREGRTLIFVSHNLPAVEGLCSEGALLIDGKLTAAGPVRNVLADYLRWIDRQRMQPAREERGHGDVKLVEARCVDSTGRERYQFRSGEGIAIQLRFRAERPVSRPHVNVGITDGRPGVLVQPSMLLDGRAPNAVEGTWVCTCTIRSLPLRPRLYYVFCDIFDQSGHAQLMSWTEATTFSIEPSQDAPGPLGVTGESIAGPVVVEYDWTVEP